ncbi:MAG: glycosyltransferase [Candidatus Tantalella remota]|nr:glycosyltransferase [Candidatus Tantalella remota]
MEKCSIIIAAYNEADNLKKCLFSLRDVDYSQDLTEIIVVDNDSTDNTASMVKEFPEVLYLKEEKRGASQARNTGIHNSTGDILIFIDTDTTVTQGWLAKVTEPFSDKTVGAVGGAIYPVNSNNIFSKYMGVSLFLRYPRYGKKIRIKGFPSCNLAVRKILAENGFDTQVFSTYGEDKDLCYRIIANGYTVLFSPEAVIYHHHPESFGDLLDLLIKSSAGRAAFAKKYPSAPDIIFLNCHIPFLYSAAVILSLLLGGPTAFMFALVPALIYFAYSSIISLSHTGDVFLSLIVKPFLDIVSIYVIYFSFHYKKLRAVITPKTILKRS